MTQLRLEGWIHHLARHMVACFLTRGDLFLSWEEGLKVFDEYLIDGDWSLNAGNWMWLSASAFFHQYFRIYSPVAFGKKTDPDGKYIRKYVPVLKDFPQAYIYEPWTAPLAL
jgi:cryptochrome